MVAAAPNAGPQPSINAIFEPVSVCGSLCFRETEFWGQRQRRRIDLRTPLLLCRDRARVIPAANSGAIRERPGNISRRRTAWWRTQSQSNPSPLPNSLLTGKITGNFVETARFVRYRRLASEQFQRLTATFPTLQNRELFRRNREFWRGTGNFTHQIRNHNRMRFSVHKGTNHCKGPSSWDARDSVFRGIA